MASPSLLVALALLLSAAGCVTEAGPIRATDASVFIPFTGSPPPASVPERAQAPLARPGRYHLAFSASREHGCSLSYSNSSVSGEYALDLAPDGRATLAITSRTTTRSGSWSIASTSNEGPTTETMVSASTWKGAAREAKGGVRVVLHEARFACGRPGGGCSSPKTLELTCAFERVEVAPARPDPDAAEPTEPVEVLRCAGGPAPLFGDEDPAFTQHLPLSGSASLALSSRHRRWSSEREATLSLEPPPP
jgi:hypothetical protein